MIYPEIEQELRALLKAVGCDEKLVDQLDEQMLYQAGWEALREVLKP